MWRTGPARRRLAVAAVAALGYRLALVGTSLMKHSDAARATAALIEAGREARSRDA